MNNTVEVGLYRKRTAGFNPPALEIVEKVQYGIDDVYVCVSCYAERRHDYEEGYLYQCLKCDNVEAYSYIDDHTCCTDDDGDPIGMDRIYPENGEEDGKYCYSCDAGLVRLEDRWCCDAEGCEDEIYANEEDILSHITGYHVENWKP